MKKTLLTIAATTALWAVVGYAAVAFNYVFVLTREDMGQVVAMFSSLQENFEQLLQAYWTCKHST